MGPEIVLLDIAFTPADPNHGEFRLMQCAASCSCRAVCISCCLGAGFLLGSRQTLLETKDGGKTWSKRDISAAKDEGFNFRFTSISFQVCLPSCLPVSCMMPACSPSSTPLNILCPGVRISGVLHGCHPSSMHSCAG